MRENAAPGAPLDAVRFLATLWAGLVIGVSFIATPAKFRADSLTRPVALDVGRTTFHTLAPVEWVLAIALVALVYRASRHGDTVRLATAGAAAVAMVLLQSVWLRPALDDRVETIISGGDPPASLLHLGYGATEIAKVVALVTIGWVARRRPGADRPDPACHSM